MTKIALKKRLEESDNRLQEEIKRVPLRIQISILEIKEYFHQTYPATLDRYEQFIENIHSINQDPVAVDEVLNKLDSSATWSNRKKIAINTALGSLMLLLTIMSTFGAPSSKNEEETLPDFVLKLLEYMPIAMAFIGTGLCLYTINSISRNNDLYDKQYMLFKFFKQPASNEHLNNKQSDKHDGMNCILDV